MLARGAVPASGRMDPPRNAGKDTANAIAYTPVHRLDFSGSGDMFGMGPLVCIPGWTHKRIPSVSRVCSGAGGLSVSVMFSILPPSTILFVPIPKLGTQSNPTAAQLTHPERCRRSARR